MRELSPYFMRRTDALPRREAGGFEPGAGEGQIHLRHYWLILRKRLRFILLVCLCTVLTAVLVVFTMIPTYTATTTLLIERQVPQVLNIPEVVSQSLGPDEYDYYQTQYEILKNPTLVAQVIRGQSLEENGHLSGEGKKGLPGELFAKTKAWIQQFFPVPPAPHEDNPLGVDLRVVDLYLQRLNIEPVRRTRLVNISFSSPSSGLAARVANAHAEAYVGQGLALRSRASEEARSFLESKLEEVKERVEKSEAALNAYRRDRGIISLDDKENIVVARLSDLNKLLTEAEAERIGFEAQVRLIRRQDYDSLPAVIGSTLIQTLKGQLVGLKGEYASLATQFKPGFTRLDQLKAQVDETQNRLGQEVQKVVKGIESAYLAAVTKEQELRAKMEEQKLAALSLKDASVEYAILAREVDTNRQLYDSVLARRKEMEVATGLQASNIFVINKAIPPLKPSKPNKMSTLILSLLVGSVGGLGLAFFLEYLDNTLKTPEEVERYLLLPNLSVVPDFLSLDRRSSSPLSSLPLAQSSVAAKDLIPSHSPFSAVTEAYRMLRTAIVFSQGGKPPQTILFTSSTHAEGKTVTLLNSAIVFAQMGARVLVIDADLRRSRCHKILGLRKTPGLADLLAGDRELQAVQPTAINHLYFLSSGSLPANPAELLGSNRMRDVLGALRKYYEYILIDSPPVMPVTDAVLLSTMVDGVILVVNSQKTPNYVIKETLLRLSSAQAKTLGTVLNCVSMRNGEYAYSYHPYCSYYPQDTAGEAE